jgi:uncharacterized protein YcbK (DUF882 family)
MVMIEIPQGGSNFYLSENFMTWEFRCKCCRVVKVDEDLINALEELRELAGGPIYVTSGYRCSAHNKAVGGAKASYHMKGMAADIWSETVSPNDMARYASLVPLIKGIGIYTNFTHVDVRDECAYWISNAVKV